MKMPYILLEMETNFLCMIYVNFMLDSIGIF